MNWVVLQAKVAALHGLPVPTEGCGACGISPSLSQQQTVIATHVWRKMASTRLSYSIVLPTAYISSSDGSGENLNSVLLSSFLLSAPSAMLLVYTWVDHALYSVTFNLSFADSALFKQLCKQSCAVAVFTDGDTTRGGSVYRKMLELEVMPERALATSQWELVLGTCATVYTH